MLAGIHPDNEGKHRFDRVAWGAILNARAAESRWCGIAGDMRDETSVIDAVDDCARAVSESDILPAVLKAVAR